MSDTTPAAFRSRTLVWARSLSICLAFIVAAAVYGYLGATNAALMTALAAGFGAYMALNIGANDVANNIGQDDLPPAAQSAIDAILARFDPQLVDLRVSPSTARLIVAAANLYSRVHGEDRVAEAAELAALSKRIATLMEDR